MAPTPKRKGGSYFGRLGANRRFLLPISMASPEAPTNKLVMAFNKVS